jgi:hypothetical protein
MAIGDLPPATLPVEWLPLYSKAIGALKGRPGLKEHNVRLLFALLHQWGNLPDMTQPGVGLADITDHAYAYYTKKPSHRLGGQNKPWLKLFGNFAERKPQNNDWRVAVNSQRGFGCFATPSELAHLPFKRETRDQCVHRNQPAGGQPPMNIGCDLSPRKSNGTYTPCWDERQHVALSPKLLRQEGNGSFTYQKVEPIPEDIDLLTGDGDAGKVPTWPLIAALYGGSPMLNPGGSRRGMDDLLADHHLPTTWRNDLLVSDPAHSANAAVLSMTESSLLVDLHDFFTQRGLILRRDEVINFYLSLKPRAFVILSGISGTGKSWLSRLFAEALRGGQGSPDDNFAQIPVGPEWRDKTYLLGFWNQLTNEFQPGPMYTAIKAADSQNDAPFFALLDETNLARIEYYFSDFLSVMETREDRGGNYETLPIGFSPKEALPIPDNLFVVGTVNVDESTHGLSRKVLDRANTIELDEVDLDLLPAATGTGQPEARLATLGEHLRDRRFRTLADVAQQYPDKLDEWNEFVKAANAVLKMKRRHFGARVRDEIVIYMAYAWDLLQDAQATGADLGDFSERRALDYQFVQKIIPRLFGTQDELAELLSELKTLAEDHDLDLTVDKLTRMGAQEIISPWSA